MTVLLSLSQCEATIERGMASFMEIGEALVRIRDGKLYRAHYPTFEAYCADRWGWSRQRAYKIIDAAEVTRSMSPMGDIPAPTSERQARELVGLKPETAAEVMTKAAESGKVTAATIREAREQVAPVAKITETTKTETYVNTETGEVAPVEKFLADDTRVQRARYVADFHKAIGTAGRVTEFQPADVANLTADEWKAIDLLLDSLTRWRDAITAARPRHLRSV